MCEHKDKCKFGTWLKINFAYFSLLNPTPEYTIEGGVQLMSIKQLF